MSDIPLVIVNPASAKGGTASDWPKMASDMRTHFGAFACAFTSKEGEAETIAKDEAGRRSFIIACGGDGTVSEVANGILSSGVDVELGVLPSGTGGDFRRSLKIPVKTKDAARALKEGRAVRVDVGRATFRDHGGAVASRYFVGTASFGLSPDVLRRMKEANSQWTSVLPGNLSYAVATLKSSVTSAPVKVRMRLDDRPERRLSVLDVCVSNAQFFGGGMKIAPDAKLNDGMLDLISIGDLGWPRLLLNSYKVYLGTHLGMSEVQHALVKRLAVEPDNGKQVISIELDGELPGRLPAEFEVVPSALRVRFGGNWK